MADATRTHYRAIGVGPRATDAEIRQAYLRLARTLHPDRYMDASGTERALAERRMREVNAAWAVLGRVESRRAYDRQLASDRRRAPSSPGGADRGPRGGPGPAPAADDGLDPVVESDDVELSAPIAFLLRRGPIVVFLAIAIGLFVGTALAGGGGPERGPAPTPTSIACVAPGDC